MKKIFVFLLLMVVSFSLKAQYPIQQNLGSDSTIIYIKGAARTVGGFVNGTYTDTTAANLTRIRQYQAAQIFTTNDSAMWFRMPGATKWVRFMPATPPSPNVDTSYWSLSGNYVADRVATPKLGTTTGHELNIITNDTIRLTIPVYGIRRVTGNENRYLVIDTTIGSNMYVGYMDGGSGSTYTAGNGITLSGSQFKLGGTLSENTNIVVDNGFRMGFDLDPSDAIFSVSTNNSDTVLKIVNDNRIYLPQIFTVSSATGRKVALIDTATGKVERIDPSALSGGSQTLQQVLTTGSTLTTNNTIASGANSLTFSNDRGTVVFDNTSNPLVKLNGTGSAALFQADSAGVNKMRLTSRGQLALGDSVNLSIFIGHNSGLNYQPQGAVNNPPGRWNNSHGTNALASLTIGNDNNAFGLGVMNKLTDGTHNFGGGTAVLNECISCDDMVFIGTDAAANHVNSIRGTGIGSYTQYLAKGDGNTSTGYGTLYGQAGQTDHTGTYNTADGYLALNIIRSSSFNVGVGAYALTNQTTGGAWSGNNTALGSAAGYTTNGDYNLFLGNYSGYFSNESNAFYLHTLASGISTENDGKNYSMLYGKFASSGANKLRMNGKFGIHSLNNDAAWLPDSAFHVVGNSWLNGKLRITDGTQSNGYVLTSDANGNASWQASSSGFTNPMTTEGDLILATTGGTATRLGIGANGYVLTSNGTTASWQAASGGGGGIDSATVRNLRWKYRNTFELQEEWLGDGVPAQWRTVASGAGSVALNTGVQIAWVDSTYQGAVYAETGTTTTGYSLGIYGNSNSSNTGSFRGSNTKKAVYETRIRFDTLSNGTNSYTALFGYIDWWASSFYQVGVKFVYDNATYGDYWVLRADDGGTSAVVTTTAVAANTDYVLRIEIDNFMMGSTGGSVTAYINDVEVVASSGTYPIVSNINKTNTLYPCLWIQKTAGTTSRRMISDWVYQYAEFITR